MATRAPGRNTGAVVIEEAGRPKIVVYVFGRYVRIAHWIRNATLIWMVLSGIYIANPFLARNFASDTAFNFFMAQVRGWHVAAGWVLLAFTLARIYQFLFVRADGKLGLGREVRMLPIVFNWRAWREQLAFYFLFRREHPHYTYSNYGPLQYLTYFFLYAALLTISVTGILLAAPYVQPGSIADWGAGLFTPIEVWIGGIAQVRIVHHITMWFFIVFTLIHVYMAVWNSLRSGNMMIESMVSGFQHGTETARPAELEDLKGPRGKKGSKK